MPVERVQRRVDCRPPFRGARVDGLAFTIPFVEMMNLCRQSPLLRWAQLAVLTGMLAACAGAPQRDVSSGTAAPARAQPAPVAATASAPPVPEPAPAPAAATQNTALSPQELQRSVSAALEQELRRVLQSEPGHRLAQSLMRQIKDDPVALLGRESFAYRVQAGESLSRIAQRFMNDLHLFYALARYNNIKVPKAVAGGQMIRVPGKAPPAGSQTAPATAPAQATSTATPVPASAPVDARANTVSPDAAAEAVAARAAKQKADMVARQTRLARTAFAKQDLDAALRAWDAVLELEPDNRTALLERQKVIGLKEKLGKVK
jgi:LysM domain